MWLEKPVSSLPCTLFYRALCSSAESYAEWLFVGYDLRMTLFVAWRNLRNHWLQTLREMDKKLRPKGDNWNAQGYHSTTQTESTPLDFHFDILAMCLDTWQWPASESLITSSVYFKRQLYSLTSLKSILKHLFIDTCTPMFVCLSSYLKTFKNFILMLKWDVLPYFLC